MPGFLRTLPLAAVLAATALGAPIPAQATAPVASLERIAVVDVQRVILETKEGRRARKELERTFARSRARLESKGKALEKRFQDLRAKAPMLSEKKLLERQQELMRAQAELEQLGAELQQEVMEKEALLTEKIYNKVAVIVRQIALEDKVQVVLVRGEMTVLYANPKLDITNRVIVAYDKKHR